MWLALKISYSRFRKWNNVITKVKKLVKNLVLVHVKKESSQTRDEKLLVNDESKKIREKIRDGAPPPPFSVTISHGRRKVNRRCVKHERARLLRRVSWWISRPGIKKGQEREEKEEEENRWKMRQPNRKLVERVSRALWVRFLSVERTQEIVPIPRFVNHRQ